AGSTQSPDFPTTGCLGECAPAPKRALDGPQDAFVAVLDSAGALLTHGTYLGGTGTDRALAVTLRPCNPCGEEFVFVAGETTSTDFWFPSFGGGVSDGFAAQLAVTLG